jgi:hypothetical protein
MVFFIRPHQIIPSGVDFEAYDGVNDRNRAKHQLRIEYQPFMADDECGQPPQEPGNQTVFRQPFDLH